MSSVGADGANSSREECAVFGWSGDAATQPGSTVPGATVRVAGRGSSGARALRRGGSIARHVTEWGRSAATWTDGDASRRARPDGSRRMSSSRRSLSLGPIRTRRVVCIPWFALFFLADPLAAGGSLRWSALALLAIGLVCAVRAARMRIERSDEQLVVVNVFRTIRLPLASVKVAGFAPARWDGFAVPLVLAGDGFAVRASGVSIWSRQWRWPDQPFVRGKRALRRIEAFFADLPIVFDARDPVPTKPV